jgi:hypothetical protein
MASKAEAARNRKEEQDARYQAIKDTKASQLESGSVPRCERCVGLHLCCPGPETDQNGEWDYDSDWLRCRERKKTVVCEFLGARTHV